MYVRLGLVVCGLLLGSGLGPVGGVMGATAQTAPSAAAEATADSSVHPNERPYTTDRSVAYHVLATPAYVLHGVTRPLAWGVRFVERRYPELFSMKLPPRGVLPLLELGGPAGVMGGLLAYDNHLLGSDHRARVEGLFGSQDVFQVRGRYQAPSLFGDATGARVAVNVFSDPSTSFFLDGNEADREADKARFEREQVDVTVGARYSRGPVTGHLDVLYEHVSAGATDTQRGDRLREAGLPGLRTLDLLTPRLSLLLSRTVGRPRTYLGTELLLQADYTHDLGGTRFQYGRYVAELRQYLPVGVFPRSRRLALRARLEQVEPLGGGTRVPFYQQPALGGQNFLRGGQNRRFQDQGSLLLTAEYRYPIWDLLDAVVFVDAGQVFPTLERVAADRFHWGYGGGVHLLNQRGLSARFEVAGGVDGVRTILTVEPSFRRIAR